MKVGKFHARGAFAAGAIGLGLLLAACGGGSSGGTLSQALQLQQHGHLDQAKAIYLKLLRTDPRNYFAQYDLGVIAQAQGDTTEALTRYEAAVSINPNFPAALYNEATIYGKTQPLRAQGLYRQVIKLQPTFATAYLNLGFLLLDAGHVQGAVHNFAEAVNQKPDLLSRLPSQFRGVVTAQAAHLPKPKTSATATATASASASAAASGSPSGASQSPTP